MASSSNRTVWDDHYRKKRSKLLYPDETVVRYFSNLFNKVSRKLTILDLGCGSGRHISFLSQHSATCLGQDFVLEILKKSKKVTKEGGFICGKADALPFRTNSFDVVLAWGVLHYLSNTEIQKSIFEIYRVLKSGAPFLGTLRSKRDTHLSWVLKRGDLKSGQVIFYGKKKALKMFKGFSTVRYGSISRQPLDSTHLIAHHVIEAVK